MVVVLSGADRSSVGRRLAESLGFGFVDGGGNLDRLRVSIREWLAERRNIVLASPTLPTARLAIHPSVRFIHLVGSEAREWTREVPVIDTAQPIDAVVDAARTFISL